LGVLLVFFFLLLGGIPCAIYQHFYGAGRPTFHQIHTASPHFIPFNSNMNSPIPSIAISLAPPEEIPEEPYSPFSPKFWPVVVERDDGFRPQLLSPPPTGSSPRFPRQLSPLCPPDSPVIGSGIQRERFEAMLKASKERSMAVGAKKSADLRKEIALKTHKNKQRQ